MPGRPNKPCAYPGCGKLVDDGSSRCAAHKVAAWSHVKGGRELSRHERGYGTAWDKLRLQILKRDNHLCKCAECTAAARLRPATEVDHIISKARWQAIRGTLAGCDAPSNLQAINHDCHLRKTQAERTAAHAA